MVKRDAVKMSRAVQGSNGNAVTTTLPPVHKEKKTAQGSTQKRKLNGSTLVHTGPNGTTTTTTVVGNPSNVVNGRIPNPRQTQSVKRMLVGAQSPQDIGKLTVVLDVDETLIHSRLTGQQELFRQAEDRKIAVDALDEFSITLADGELVKVNKRPGLDSFLAEAAKHYELMAYTAGLEEYARPLLDWLDPTGSIFRYRLYRDSCVFAKGYYLKDLSKLNRSLSRIVLVDNNAFCFLPQLANGIPISSFYDDPTDTALSVLLTFLERIRDEQDVRPFLRKSFNLETLLKEHRSQILG